MWLRNVTSGFPMMNNWFPTEIPVLAHVVGEPPDVKRKQPIYTGSPKKITPYYYLKSKQQMEMTVKGNAMFDYISANACMFYSSNSGNDWVSRGKTFLNFITKPRRQMWITICGLPEEESLLAHEMLKAKFIDNDIKFICKTDWTGQNGLKYFQSEKVDRGYNRWIKDKHVTTRAKKDDLLVFSDQPVNLLTPHVLAPMSFPLLYHNGSVKNHPLVLAIVFPSQQTNEKAREELAGIFAYSRDTNVDLAVCGLEVASLKPNNMTYSDQWKRLQNETMQLTSEACAIEFEERVQREYSRQEREFISEHLYEIEPYMSGLRNEMCTSSQAKVMFGDIAWTFTNDVGKNDGYLARINRLLIQRGYEQRQSSSVASNTNKDDHDLDHFGNRAKLTIVDTMKCLNGEMTEQELTERENEMNSFVENSYPPLYKVQGVLRSFRKEYFIANAKESIVAKYEFDDIMMKANKLNAESISRELPVGMMSLKKEQYLKSVADLDKVGASKSDNFYVQLLAAVSRVEEAIALEEDTLKAFERAVATIMRLCDDEQTPMLFVQKGEEEADIDNLVHDLIEARKKALSYYNIIEEKDNLLLDEKKVYPISFIEATVEEIKTRHEKFGKAMEKIEVRYKKLSADKQLFQAMKSNDHFALRVKIDEAKAQSSASDNLIAMAETRFEEGQKAYSQYLKDTFVKRGMTALRQHYPSDPNVVYVNAGKSIWYDKNAVLGKGSQGVVVYEGKFDKKHATKDEIETFTAAIKRIPLGADSEEAEKKKRLIKRECEIHQKVRSNRVINFIGSELYAHDDDDARDDRAAYVATELCGETLSSWLKDAENVKNNIRWEERVNVISQISQAVREMHDSGVAHNDIKADNCLRSMNDKHFKLSDFGLAIQFDDRLKSYDAMEKDSHDGKKVNASSYNFQSVLGTDQMQNSLSTPPELLGPATKLTPKRDVWNLGCLAFQILTGAWSPYSIKEIKITDSNQFEIDESLKKFNNKKRNGEHSMREALETASLPRHVQVSAKWLIEKTLDPNPDNRPSSSEFHAMVNLWDPNKSMDVILKVYDERSNYSLQNKTTEELVAKAWGKRYKGSQKKVTENVENWKKDVIPELLARSEKRRLIDGGGGDNIARQQSGVSGGDGGKQPRGGKRKSNRGGAEKLLSSTSPTKEDEGIERTIVENTDDLLEKTPTTATATTRVFVDEEFSSSLSSSSSSSSNTGGAYSSDFAGLIHFIRNVSTHPPYVGSLEYRKMIEYLKNTGFPHVKRDDEDVHKEGKRLVTMYLVTQFPDAAIIAYSLAHPPSSR